MSKGRFVSFLSFNNSFIHSHFYYRYHHYRYNLQFINNKLINNHYSSTSIDYSNENIIDQNENSNITIGDQFYKDALSGITGKLAIAYERQNWDQLISLHQIIKFHNIPLRSTLPINYLVNAYLNTNQPIKAYSLLKEMESIQLIPTIMTFEILMNALSKYSHHGIQIEELWTLMTRKYSMEPSDQCWQSRISVWISRSNNPTTLIAIDLLEEYRRKSKEKREKRETNTNLQNFYSINSETLSNLFIIAARRGNWKFIDHLLKNDNYENMENMEKHLKNKTNQNEHFNSSSIPSPLPPLLFYSGHWKGFMEESMIYKCNQIGILKKLIDRFKGVPYEGLVSKCLDVAYRSVLKASSIQPCQSHDYNHDNHNHKDNTFNDIKRVATWSFKHLINLSVHDNGMMPTRYIKTFSFIMKMINSNDPLYRKLNNLQIIQELK